MDLKAELPKLGKDVDGAVKFGIDSKTPGVISRWISFTGARPDYDKLKMEEHNSELDCVSMIVGLKDPNMAFLVFKNHAEEHKNDVRIRITDKGIFTHNREVFDYFRAAIALFHEIRRDIDVGIGFKKIIYQDLPGGPKTMGNLFSSSRYFDTMSFLNYMREKKYRIPDELATQKEKKPKQKIIPVPPKTQWHQIHFRIVNPNRIEITTPEGMKPYYPDDLGFTPKIWEKFEQFAIAVEHTPGTLDGHAGKTHRSDVPEYISADRADMSRLRKLLKTVFPGVEGDPISNVKTKRI
jgi:hypothetical protein